MLRTELERLVKGHLRCMVIAQHVVDDSQVVEMVRVLRFQLGGDAQMLKGRLRISQLPQEASQVIKGRKDPEWLNC